jgi:hypothetical protein
MFHEVKIFDKKGEVKKVLPAKTLVRSTGIRFLTIR